MHSSRRPFDAIVIGGGVVGIAVLRELTVKRGWRCLLVEAAPHLLAGASSGNTGIACTASDVQPGTLEHSCLTRGTKLNLPTWEALHVPHRRPSGAMYVAKSAAERAVLQAEHAERAQRGDTSPRMLSADEARRREPGLASSIAGALLLQETVVDPWLAPMAYARHAFENGATVRRGTTVSAAAWQPSDALWRLRLSPTLAAPERAGDACGSAPSTGRGGAPASAQEEAPPADNSAAVGGDELARVVVACGGLRGDQLESLHRAEPPFRIRPRRGDYVIFGPAAADAVAGTTGGGALCRTPVGQVPSATSRGVYVWQSVHGVVACGPTAEDVDERTTPPRPTHASVRAALAAAAAESVPVLAGVPTVGTYAGLRPGCDVSKDYQIGRAAGSGHSPGWVTVGAIRSTGLTASLGIACHVADLCESERADIAAADADAAVVAPPLPPRPSQVRTTPLPPVEQIVASFRERADGSVVFGMDEAGFGAHYVTHPLTRAGFERLAALQS